MTKRNPDGTWKKGFQPEGAGKPKGAISEKTAVWNEISEWFKGQGIEAYQEELMKMRHDKPDEFMKRFETMLEYFQPKLSRTELKADVNQDDGIDYSQLSEQALKEIANAKSKS